MADTTTCVLLQYKGHQLASTAEFEERSRPSKNGKEIFVGGPFIGDAEAVAAFKSEYAMGLPVDEPITVTRLSPGGGRVTKTFTRATVDYCGEVHRVDPGESFNHLGVYVRTDNRNSFVDIGFHRLVNPNPYVPERLMLAIGIEGVAG